MVTDHEELCWQDGARTLLRLEASCRLTSGGIAGQCGQCLAVDEAEVGPPEQGRAHVVDRFLFGVGEGERSRCRSAHSNEAFRGAVGPHCGVRVGPFNPLVDELLAAWGQRMERPRR